MAMLNRKAIKACSRVTTNDTRYALDSVKVEASGDKVTATATNGYLLVRVIQQGVPPHEAFPTMTRTISPVASALIGIDQLQTAMKAMPSRSSIPALEHAFIGADENGSVVIAATDLEQFAVIESKASDRTFPDESKVIGAVKLSGGEDVEVRLSAVMLRHIAAIAEDVAFNRKFATVKFIFPRASMVTNDAGSVLVQGPIVAKSGIDAEVLADMVLMPMRD